MQRTATLIALAALLATAGDARADDTRVITYDTDLQKKPGEASEVVASLEVGDTVKVLRRRGRWVRVRARGKRGWIPRTTFAHVRNDKDEADGVDEDAGFNRKSREPGQVIDLNVANRRTRAHAGPSKKSKKLFKVHKGDSLEVLQIHGRWSQVRTDSGKIGWVRSSALDPDTINLDASATTAVDGRDSDPDEDVRQLARERMTTGGFELDTGAAIGFSAYSRSFTSNGEGPLGGYEISTGSMVATADVRTRLHLGRISVAISGRYAGSLAAPGIRYRDTDQMVDPNSLVTHDARGSFEVGYSLGKKRTTRVSVGAGAGVSYFVVGKIQNNPGLLARERLFGITGNAAVETVVAPRVLVDVGLDVMPHGLLDQTVNLEDGTSSKVWAIGGGAEARYLLDPRTTITAGYRARRTKYSFSGQSPRQFDVTQARRRDTTHTLTVGAARSF